MFVITFCSSVFGTVRKGAGGQLRARRASPSNCAHRGKLHRDFITWAVAKPVGPGQTTVSGHATTGDVGLYDKPGGKARSSDGSKTVARAPSTEPCPIQSADDTNGWCVTDTARGGEWGGLG
jgi:hypothetical protein